MPRMTNQGSANRNATAKSPPMTGAKIARRVVGDQQQQHDDAADQDLYRPRVIVEAGAGEMGIAVEIALAANLGPGRIDAERDDRKKHVDDPDAEIFAGGAGEGEILAPHPDGARRGGLRYIDIDHFPLVMQ